MGSIRLDIGHFLRRRVTVGLLPSMPSAVIILMVAAKRKIMFMATLGVSHALLTMTVTKVETDTYTEF